MKKISFLLLLIAAVLIFPVLAAAQEDMSDQSLQESSEESSRDSSEESSQESTDSSFQNSSESTTDGTGENEISSAILIGGVLVAVAVTVGVVLTVRASNVRKEDALKLQDQIYMADGKEYTQVLNYFGIADRDIITANDELVTEGYKIDSNKQAADYYAALMLRCAGKSAKINRLLTGKENK